MKYTRELKVAIWVIACGLLVYFGLYFLKGQNVLSRDNHYIGLFDNVCGLKEQAPVYVRGYKVGQVDRIVYDFTKSKAFTVEISMHRDIVLTDPVEMRLFDDGLLGGKAIEVVVPVGAIANKHVYNDGDTLHAMVVQGLLETLQEGFMAKLDDAIVNLDSLIINLNDQVDDHTVQKTLENVERVSEMLVASAHDIKEVTREQLPAILNNADTMMGDAKMMVRNLQAADLPATVERVDATLDTVQSLLTGKSGTLGMLLNDKSMYLHVDSTVVSLDSLVTDLKKNPKRYVQFSLFGGKEKNKKKSSK